MSEDAAVIIGACAVFGLACFVMQTAMEWWHKVACRRDVYRETTDVRERIRLTALMHSQARKVRW
jgi:hypothetical protein